MTTDKLNVFVGWDSAQVVAYEVCRHSLLHTTSRNVKVTPLKQQQLRDSRIYRRPVDTRASTEFTFTRFFVPHLMNYRGWALFCDCDFLWLADVNELFRLRDSRFAVQVVQHDYRPKRRTKMDGKVQHPYPRKNWSSLILWNCGHPENRRLDLDRLNGATGAYLHRFQWLDDALIGALPKEWNWLAGWYPETDTEKPKAIHYTEGGPWFENCMDVEYADLWLNERDRMRSNQPRTGA